MVLPYHHVLRLEVYDILVVVFSLAEGIVTVDVLHVRISSGACHVILAAVAVHRRVALRVVEELVTVVDLNVCIVISRRAVVTEVVGRRVGGGLLVSPRRGAEALLYGRQIVGEERLLVEQVVGGAQTVITHILIHARGLVVVKSVDDRLCRGHTPPDGGVYIDHREACRQPVLEALATVTQYILADVAKVYIQASAAVRGVIDKGVHEPELYGLYVLRLKVGIVQLAHDAAPAACRALQQSVAVDAGAVW